jgi:hypothetical protein
MTKDDSDYLDTLALLALTNIWCNRFPDLRRDLVRSNVSAALSLIPRGLMQAQVCGVTGEINEATNWYEVRVP